MIKKRTKIVILTAAMLLVLTAGIGLTSAYFTDYENARGGAVIELGGQTELTEIVKDGNKNVSISNTGDTDMIVRVMIYGDTGRISNVTGDGWNKGADKAYYYNKVLHKGESTGTLTVNVRTGSSDTDDFEVIVVHEGSRAVYDGTADPEATVQKLVAPEGWNADEVSKISAE